MSTAFIHGEIENTPESRHFVTGENTNAKVERLQQAVDVLIQATNTDTDVVLQQDDRLQRLGDATTVLANHVAQATPGEDLRLDNHDYEDDLVNTSLTDEQKALVAEYMGLARSIAKKYLDRGEPFDDLLQVAHIGLIKAASRFDNSKGEFIGYAATTMRGEIMRHFRDFTWSVHVSRSLKDVAVNINRTQTRLEGNLGRQPTDKEVADSLGVSVENYLDAKYAMDRYRATSLDRSLTSDGGSASLGSVILDKSNDFLEAENKQFIDELLAHLNPREILILKARSGMHPFDREHSQAEVAEMIGTSQVHVGRLEARALEKLYAIGTKSMA